MADFPQEPIVAGTWKDELLTNAFVSATLAIAVTSGVGAACVWLSTRVLEEYGFFLFIALPLLMGFLGSVIHGCRVRRTLRQCSGVVAIATAITTILLLVFLIEGLACILMAAPLVLVVGMFPGAFLGYLVQARRHDRRIHAATMLLALAAMPALMGAQAAMRPAAPLRCVKTALTIDAPPETVWRNVVEFSDIPDTPAWYFRHSIAYPVRARIEGRGVGAIRYCEFTTGPFVEPITTWDEPRLLAFDVRSNPPCLTELNPFGPVDSAHRHGYLASERGQLALEPLPGGRTRLEGTTWYRHAIGPDWYWGLWSDALIHRIHLRVLNRIKTLSEAKA